MDREQSVQHFLDLLKKSRRGNFKIYIGMIAGVGKSYRMLSDAHQLLESGIDVKIGYIETSLPNSSGLQPRKSNNWQSRSPSGR